ncbi:hypothetical protein GQ43DRAFT_239903 [Delitschia confertaspora ATCC 74209]|uniref:Uncharacterized protein n=1 Tax=Delitschia confertaspora ATCC 74209 TaxID=1513339 RepID=A0A9P4JQP1_9PLEO|nr:hypothetical protein GQ43DRAFT_239903 [Delitschia confertaspora ATCC 74209]
MSPPFIFRIDEIQQAPDALPYANAYHHWIPTTNANANVRRSGGASGVYFRCDGQRIYPLQGGTLPQGSAFYKAFSVYYSIGRGFWVLEGDATTTTPHDHGQVWMPLTFDHENYSSFLTNAGEHNTLAAQRTDQRWPAMLLPDIYHAQFPTNAAHQSYGSLTGELPIFLALLAFSVERQNVQWAVTNCFRNGKWRAHNQQRHGRIHQRGVVVYVYTTTGSTPSELDQFEKGNLGKYFN